MYTSLSLADAHNTMNKQIVNRKSLLRGVLGVGHDLDGGPGALAPPVTGPGGRPDPTVGSGRCNKMEYTHESFPISLI
jgi:hypothetical protein